MDTNPTTSIDESAALRYVLEGTVAQTGEPFFRALAENLPKALGYRDGWITELVDGDRVRSLAAWIEGEFVEFSYALDNTPCEPVIRERRFVHHPDGVQAAYPEDQWLARIGAVSYMGVPLCDTDGTTLGHVSVIGADPKPAEPLGLAVLKTFASRAEVELQQLQAQRALAASEQRASNLLKSAMDGILVLDQSMSIRTINGAAARMLGVSVDAPGCLATMLAEPDRERLARLLDLESTDQPYLPLPAGMTLATSMREFIVEGTLSRFLERDVPLYTVIFRDIGERLAAEQHIERLLAENRYLEQKLGGLGAGNILGVSTAVQKAVQDAQQVADTNATVLIHGETGTGKELFANAVHNWSPRSDGPLIAVNCAALPGELIESELFGHEKGAFTGAAQRRVGRFALADGGTIFLDEIGDLPITLQAKLLRVLQEGQFEPVGSSTTQSVDVRVVAATNRNLFDAMQEGRFREDLYYRLNVFPIEVPPLRERGRDVVMLAEAFLADFATQFGRPCAPLTEGMKTRLMAYGWPGNVRELRNVIERAVICASGGQIDLDRALPHVTGASAAVGVDAGQVLTVDALRELESNNIRRALELTSGRVSGPSGAAALLNMKPSTLSSRIRSLGIDSG